MKNTSKTGNAFQDWILKWILENYKGSAVHNQKSVAKVIKLRDPKTGQLVDRWVSQRNDILGCIDLIWVSAAGTIVFIQATMDTGVSRKLEELNKIPWNLANCMVQLWLKREPTRVDIFTLTSGKKLQKTASIVHRKVVFDF